VSDPNRYYDREGQEITHDEYQALRMRGLDYARVRNNTIHLGISNPAARTLVEVSTVWDGMDCFPEYGEHTRLFETLVSVSKPKGDGTSAATTEHERYWWPTEAQAIAGHLRICHAAINGQSDRTEAEA